jgi:lipopolysaccharide biosynthesis glycosyltransferase
MLETLLKQTEHTPQLNVYLILDEVNQESFSEFIPYLHSRLPSLSILRANPQPLRHFPVNGHATVATYFRLLLPGLLPADCKRVLFIDSDTVITDDLAPLWNLDLQGKSLAAVPDHWLSCRDHGYVHGRYFNAGVMLIDLERWRQTDVIGRGASFARANPERLRHWDQDVLNHVFEDDWLPIGERWNACPHLFGLLPEFSLRPEDLTPSEQEAISNPAIIHFAGPGPVKPWNARCKHPLRHHYLDARAQTPWADNPLDDAPPPKLKRVWTEAVFQAKCYARRILR